MGGTATREIAGHPKRRVRLVIDWPPSGNHYKRHYCTVGPKHRVGVYVTPEARRYTEATRDLIAGELSRRCPTGFEPMTGPVRLIAKLYRPTVRSDLDNALKVTQDLLAGLVYLDDKQIVELHIYAYDDDKRDPRIDLAIEECRVHTTIEER